MDNNEGLSGVIDFSFTKYVTPVIVKILYILVIALSVLLWLFTVLGSFIAIFNGGSFVSFLGLLIGATLGFAIIILMYRIMFELVMVIFSIKENTDRIK